MDFPRPLPSFLYSWDGKKHLSYGVAEDAETRKHETLCSRFEAFIPKAPGRMRTGPGAACTHHGRTSSEPHRCCTAVGQQDETEEQEVKLESAKESVAGNAGRKCAVIKESWPGRQTT